MNETDNNVAGQNEIAKNMFWSFAEKCSAQIVSTIVGIVLARMLSPEDYGIISMVMIFISICNIFVTRGLGISIVQKKEVNDYDYTTAFLLNLCMGLSLYSVLFYFAPVIEQLCGIKRLTEVLRVLGIRIPLASIITVQQAYIQRNMQFKKFFFATLLGTVISCVIGIVMAYKEYGVWSLVAQYLSNALIDTFVLTLVSGWHPRGGISKKSVEYVLRYGGKIIVMDLICGFADNYRYFIAGKNFGAKELAYMEQGKKYPQVIVANVLGSIQQVMLAGFAKNQDNLSNLKKLLRSSVNYGFFLLAPMLIGFMALSDSFVEVVLTDKWILIVKFIYIYCITYLINIFGTINNQAILAIGRNDIVLKIQVIINVLDIFLVTLVVLLKESVYMLVCTTLITNIVGVFLFSLSVREKIKYGFKEQLKDIMPTLMVSCFMGIIVYGVGKLKFKKMFLLAIQIFVGIIIYFILAAIFKLDGYYVVKDKLLGRIKVYCKQK